MAKNKPNKKHLDMQRQIEAALVQKLLPEWDVNESVRIIEEKLAAVREAERSGTELPETKGMDPRAPFDPRDNTDEDPAYIWKSLGMDVPDDEQRRGRPAILVQLPRYSFRYFRNTAAAILIIMLLAYRSNAVYEYQQREKHKPAAPAPTPEQQKEDAYYAALDSIEKADILRYKQQQSPPELWLYLIARSAARNEGTIQAFLGVTPRTAEEKAKWKIKRRRYLDKWEKGRQEALKQQQKGQSGSPK